MAATAMARRVKAPAPAMVVTAAAAALLLVMASSAPRAQAGGDEAAACSGIPVFMQCLGPEGLRAPTTTSADPDEHKALSAACCNAFADGERECLCRLRDELRRRGADPKRFLCTADTGCPDP